MKYISFAGTLQADKFIKSTPNVKSGLNKAVSSLGEIFSSNHKNKPVSTEDMDKLFLQNGFVKGKFGSVSKKLSLSEKTNIELKYGEQAGKIKDYFGPNTKERQNEFREFLEIGDNFKVAKNNFNPMFIAFSKLFDNLKNYQQFKTFLKENPAYAQLIQNAAINSPDEKIVNAIDNYKTIGYQDINNVLRDKIFYVEPTVTEKIRNITKFLNIQEIKTPIKLYRGEGFEILNNIKLSNGKTLDLGNIMKKISAGNNVDKDKLNKIREFLMNNEIVAKQPSFMSTTMDKNVAYEYYIEPQKGANVLFELTTKPNTKGAFVEQLTKRNNLSFEREVLLQRDSNIKLNDVKFKDGQWFVFGEVSN